MPNPKAKVDIASDLMRPQSAGHRHSPEYLLQDLLLKSNPELGMQKVESMGMSPQELGIGPSPDWLAQADANLARLQSMPSGGQPTPPLQHTPPPSADPRTENFELFGGAVPNRWESVAQGLSRDLAAGKLTQAEARTELDRHMMRQGIDRRLNPFR